MSSHPLIAGQLTFTTLRAGDQVTKWNGDRHWLVGRELALAAHHDGRPVGYLLFELFHPDDDCHPRADAAGPYLYLYSAWTCPRHRGRGVFGALAAQLTGRFGALPVHGVAIGGEDCTVGRFLARAGADTVSV